MRDAIAEDAALVHRAAEGEARAWRTLVDAYSGPLFRYAWRLLGERDAAEDVVQETFLRLWRSASAWKPNAPVQAWLYRVAGNVARDALRRRQKIAELAEDELDPSPGVEIQVSDSMEVDRLRAFVDELPERQRQALLLCRLEGMTMSEAASVLSCSVESVESLLARARRTLRARFAEVEIPVARSA